MAMFVIRRKFSHGEADEILRQVRLFFANNPRRKVCIADLGGVSKKFEKGKVVSTIRKSTLDGWNPQE